MSRIFLVIYFGLSKNQLRNVFSFDRFAKEYFASKIHRNYGGHVPKIFSDWSSKHLEDVFLPARQQFNGAGSFGNGGGMRIAPAALFMYNENSQKLKVS